MAPRRHRRRTSCPRGAGTPDPVPRLTASHPRPTRPSSPPPCSAPSSPSRLSPAVSDLNGDLPSVDWPSSAAERPPRPGGPGRPSPATGSATPSSRRRPTGAWCGPTAASCTPGPPGAWSRRRDRLEEMWPPCWATTSSMAGEHERALHHLEVAGDHAASRFANDEAIASYRYAMTHWRRRTAGDSGAGAARRVGRARGPSWPMSSGGWGATKKPGRHWPRRCCRPVPQDPLAAAPASRPAGGRVEISDHRYDAAMAAFDAAEELLGDHPELQDQDAGRPVAGQSNSTGAPTLHYWRNQPEQAAAGPRRGPAGGRGAGKPGAPGRLLQQPRPPAGPPAPLPHRRRDARQHADAPWRPGGRRRPRRRRALRSSAWVSCCSGMASWPRLSSACEPPWPCPSTSATSSCGVRLCYLNVTALRRHDVEAVRACPPGPGRSRDGPLPGVRRRRQRRPRPGLAWQDGRPEAVVALADAALRRVGDHRRRLFLVLDSVLWPLMPCTCGRTPCPKQWGGPADLGPAPTTVPRRA